MTLRGLAAIAAFLLVSADTRRPARAEVKSDLELLQGCWVLKTTEWCGLKADQDPTEDESYRRWTLCHRRAEERELPTDLREERTTLEIKGNNYVWRQWWHAIQSSAGVASFEGTLVLDGKRSPPILTRIPERTPGIVQTTVFSRYSIDNNTLRLLMNFSNDRDQLPTSFVTDNDEDVVVLTFKREKK
jgi:hypothetical protein